MTDTKRLFLALVLPRESKQLINAWRDRNLYTLERTPIPADNYHVTLVYIGTVTNSQLIDLINEVRAIKADSFSLNINKTDYWPKPKVIHLMPTTIPPRLIDLQRKVNKAAERAGLPTETRPYRPHLSLYRKVNQQQFDELVDCGLPEPNIDINIDHFAIYQSISTEDGVHYEKVQDFKLAGTLV